MNGVGKGSGSSCVSEGLCEPVSVRFKVRMATRRRKKANSNIELYRAKRGKRKEFGVKYMNIYILQICWNRIQNIHTLVAKWIMHSKSIQSVYFYQHIFLHLAPVCQKLVNCI